MKLRSRWTVVSGDGSSFHIPLSRNTGKSRRVAGLIRSPLLPGPVFRYVDSMVFYIIRRVESVLMNGQFQQDKGFKGALKLRDVERFQRMMLVNDR